jgi:hemoglobin-like flavoprotein
MRRMSILQAWTETRQVLTSLFIQVEEELCSHVKQLPGADTFSANFCGDEKSARK